MLTQQSNDELHNQH